MLTSCSKVELIYVYTLYVYTMCNDLHALLKMFTGLDWALLLCYISHHVTMRLWRLARDTMQSAKPDRHGLAAVFHCLRPYIHGDCDNLLLCVNCPIWWSFPAKGNKSSESPQIAKELPPGQNCSCCCVLCGIAIWYGMHQRAKITHCCTYIQTPLAIQSQILGSSSRDLQGCQPQHTRGDWEGVNVNTIDAYVSL